jgi:hypothetical protein
MHAAMPRRPADPTTIDEQPPMNTAQRLFLALFVLSGCLQPALAAPTQAAGWVDVDPVTGKVPAESFKVLRDKKPLDYEGALQACDEIELTRPDVILTIWLSDATQKRLGPGVGSRLALDCSQRGLSMRLLSMLQAALTPSAARANRAAAMASRSVDADKEALPLAAPLLDAPSNSVLAGQRSLYLRWVGGVGPFAISLQDSTGRVLARRSGLGVRETTLPTAALLPGTYRLEITQAAGLQPPGIAEDKLIVQAADSRPAMPPELAAANLPASVRALFYADFLVAQGDGRWTLEAAQIVAAIRPATPASRQWLDRYAGPLQAGTGRGKP